MDKQTATMTGWTYKAAGIPLPHWPKRATLIVLSTSYPRQGIIFIWITPK